MAIPIKSPGEIEAMRAAGLVLRRVIAEVVASCKPGVTTRDLDGVAANAIEQAGAAPVFLHYTRGDAPPFPNVSCICVNEEVVHSVPGDRIIRNGDLVTVDIALRYPARAGWCVDGATTLVVANGGAMAERLRNTAVLALDAAVAATGPGVLWCEVSARVCAMVHSHGLEVLGSYCGHGIGMDLHEPPRLCFGPQPKNQPDVVLRPGMVITLEPIVTEGRFNLVTLDDGWTVVTGDRSWCALEERTIAITPGGCTDLIGL